MRDITALAKQFYKQYGGKALYGYGMSGQAWGSTEQVFAQRTYPHIYPWKDPKRVLEIKAANPPWLSDCIGWIRLLCMHLPGLMEPGRIKYAAAVPGAPWKNLYNNKAYPDIRTDMFDISANWARDTWGKQSIGTIPEPTPSKAVAVFMEGHIGLYVGGGKVIEMTPPCLMMTALKAREKGGKWTHWAYVPAKWLRWAENVTACLGKPAQEKPATALTERNGRTYTVQPGDSWWGIAAQELGSGARMAALARYNGKTTGDGIHPGEKLNIPGK